MTQREQIAQVCRELAEKRHAMFLGYNVAKGSQMYGTLKGVPADRLVEMPCAENLMGGAAVGMALQGEWLPVVCFERHEFALFALGQLAVMADKLHSVTKGVTVPMVVRVIRGGTKPLDPGAQHCGDYEASLVAAMKDSEFLFLRNGLTYEDVDAALDRSRSGISVIMEERDGYEETVGTRVK